MTRRTALATLATTALVALAGPGAVAPAEAAGATTYYFSPTGSDSAAGTSPTAPMRSLSKVASLPLGPGDAVRLQAGGVFAETGGLTLAASGTSAAPITLGTYGTGTAPTVLGSTGSCVTVNGSHVAVSGIRTAGCVWSGFDVVGDQVALDRVEATAAYSGVQVEQSASYTSLTSSDIHDNVRMKTLALGPDDDSGAFGVLVLGDHTLVRGNTITGHDTLSLDYGRDGSAIEVYGASDTTLLANTASGNQTFVEVGGVPGSDEATGVRVSGNQVTTALPSTYFAVVHAGDGFGTAHGVRVEANTVSLPGHGSVGVVCGPACTPSVLSVIGNSITAAGGATSVGGTYATS